MKIVVCDHDLTRMRNLRSILATLGHKGPDIEAQSEPRQAINAAKKKRFEAFFVALDLNSGPKAGMELLKTIREDRRLGKMPVILYSSEISHELLMEAKGLKVTNIMAYPFSVNDVEASILAAEKVHKS